MAEYSRVELAKMLQVGNNYIGQYITRGKIVLNKKGNIDSKNEKNAAFIQKMLDRLGSHVPPASELHVTTPAVEAIPPADVVLPPTDLPKRNKRAAPPGDYDSLGIFELEKAQKIAELRKKELDGEMVQKKLDKLDGILIPTEAVKQIFPLHCKSVYTEFENLATNQLKNIAKKYEMTPADVAQYRTELINGLNEAIKTSVKQTIKEISSVVAQFSDSRGRGERR